MVDFFRSLKSCAMQKIIILNDAIKHFPFIWAKSRQIMFFATVCVPFSAVREFHRIKINGACLHGLKEIHPVGTIEVYGSNHSGMYIRQYALPLSPLSCLAIQSSLAHSQQGKYCTSIERVCEMLLGKRQNLCPGVGRRFLGGAKIFFDPRTGGA